MPDCGECGAPNAAFGLGPPIHPEPRHYCGVCIQFQPATQRSVAWIARGALEDDEISVR